MTALVFDVVAHDGASASLGRIGHNLDGNTSKWRKLGSVIKTAGKAAAVGLVAASVVAVGFAKSAAEDQVQTKQLSIAMVNNAHASKSQRDEVDKWILSASRAKGVSEGQLRPAFTKLVTATHDVSKAQHLTNLAMSVAAGTGKSLETVTAALARGYNGSTTGLSRLGIKTTEVTKNSAALAYMTTQVKMAQTAAADAATKYGASSDQARLADEKATLAGQKLQSAQDKGTKSTMDFDQIQKQLSATFRGQAGAAADTASGQYARLSVMLHQAAVNIGDKLLPYAMRLGDWMINTGVPAVEKLGSWLQGKLAPAVQYVSDYFAKGGDNSKKLGGAMKDLGGFVSDVTRAWKALSPFLEQAAKDYLPVMVEQLTLVAKVLKATGDAAIWLWNNAWGPTLKFELNALGDMAKGAGEVFKVLGHAPGFGWAKDLGNALINDADGAHNLADKINHIPTHHDTAVTVHYNYVGANPGGGGSSPSGPVRDPVGRAAATPHGLAGLTTAGMQLIKSLVAGISKGKVPAQRVLDDVTAEFQSRVDKWKGLLQQSKDFADSFSSWGTSVFSMTSNDTDGPLTVQQMLAQSSANVGQSGQVNADVQKLISEGLSKDLIEQLQAQGSSGIEALHTLASATQDQINQLNSDDAQTQANYASAGMAAANKVYAADIAQADASKDVAAALVEVIKGVQDLKNVEFTIKGSDLVAVIDKDKKDKGKTK